MRSYKTEAIVLKRRNFGEADRILTVFTKSSGKISVKAAGVRKISSKRSSHMELFNHAVFGLYKGRGMPIVTDASTINDHRLLKNDLSSVGLAYHVCELVDGLCAENQENRSVFALLQNTLSSLSFSQNPAEMIRKFEIELLSTLGFLSTTHAPLYLDTQNFIENILERRLRSKKFLTRLA